ncbi:MAG: carboxyl transferase domain-containing protein [Minwuia sp.]|nr:carboxyl transferase domain-containing protein [Minwuia sp.]
MDSKTTDDLDEHRKRARAMGGEAPLRKLANAGKLTARKRLDHLLDDGSFRELGLLATSQTPSLKERTPADGTIVGHGLIDGRPVYVSADDPSVLAGTRGRVAEVKLSRARQLAIRERIPFVMLNEAGAARLQEGRGAQSAALGEGFVHHLQMSGLVPQASLMMGPSFGGPSFVSSQGDFVGIVKGTGFLGMSGPPIVKVGIGQDFSAEEIGGIDMSARQTGQVDLVAEDEVAALESVRRFLSFMPTNAHEMPPQAPANPAPCSSDEGARELASLVPENQRRAYDANALIRLLADADSVLPIRRDYGPNLATSLARIDGRPVGIIANNPKFMAGVLDQKAAIKARKFIDTCDAFHIPLIFLCDTPGFLVGPEIERQRMVSLCGRLMNSLISATVPKVTVVIRKAVGMAYLAMCGRVCEPNAIVAWPTAFFDVMGPEAGVMLLHGKELAESPDPQVRKTEILSELEAAASCYAAAEMGLIDDVISPLETRQVISHTISRALRNYEPQFKHRIDP